MEDVGKVKAELSKGAFLLSAVSRPAASASPEMMLEMQIIGPHPRIRNSGAAQESVILIAC